jgi:hypothetical protein
MKSIEIPSLLTDLQYPWNVCSHIKRMKLVNQLPKNKDNLDTSLKLFKSSLAAFTEILQPETNLFPEDEIENWQYTNEFIADSLSNFSDMNVDTIDYFIDRRKFDKKSDHLKDQILNFWVWFNILEIINDSSEFIKQYLETNKDQYVSEEFVLVLSKYWEKLDYAMLSDLIRKIYHAKEFSTSLLCEIEKNSDDERISTIANRYRGLIQEKANREVVG